MALKKLTALEFANLKPGAKDQLVPDTNNLYVSIRSTTNGGSKAFRMTYRLDSKKIWITLKSKILADARKERDNNQALLKQGIDPRIEQKLIVERNRQAQINERAEIARRAALSTVNGLFQRWVDVSISERKDLPEVIRMFEKDVLPLIGAMTVQDVRKGHVVEIVDNLILRKAKHTARNMLKLMRQMFRFAVDRDIIDFDPTAGLSITKATTKPTERDRVLTESEIRALSRQMPNAGLMKSTECAIWIALSTMCRIGELSKAKFSDVDFNLNNWTIPAENSKNGKTHTVYLSDFALEQFKILASYRTSETWLFPNRDNSNHVCDKSITKQIGSRQSEIIYSNRPKDSKTLVLDGGKWVMHDLRRTGATIMGALKIAPDVIEKCMNHIEENKVKRIYQRQGLEKEQAEAWQTLGQRLTLIRSMDDSNVVSINARW